MKKILIIEDDKAIARLLLLALKTNNYEGVVSNSALSGLSLFLANKFDLILLDLGLPDLDGMDVIKQIREKSNVPIIVVSARDKETEKVRALDSGCDDYVTKPFNVEELLARIRVCFRKSINEVTSNIVEVNDLVIDFDKRRVSVLNEEIHLTPIEFSLLKLLVENKGKVLTHSYIQRNVWGYESFDDFQSQRVFLTSLRRKIEKKYNKQYILTEVGIGYRFIE